MHRVDTATAVASLPAVQPAGTPGFFTRGDPQTPIPATQPGPDWCNMIQEELYYLVVQAGLTPDASKADFTQVHEAVAAMIADGDAAQALGDLANVTLTSPANGEALVWNGSAWVNGTPASAIDQVYKTLLLNGLGDAIAEGAGTQQVNTWPDPFVGTTGIDGGASSGYLHDATRDVIHNSGTTVTTPSSSSDYVGETGATTFGAGSVTWGASDDNLRSNSWTAPGDFSVEANINDHGNNWGWGVYAIAEDGSFQATDTGGEAGMDVMTNSWWLDMDAAPTVRVMYGNVQQTTFSASSGDTFRISRSGSTFSVYLNDALQHTWSQTSSTEIRFACGNANQRGDLTNMTWTVPGTPSNMDLISVQRTPLAVPATGHLLALVNNLGSLTYGTDLTMSVSRDDGVTWDTATIEELGTSSVSINGTPTDCDVIYIEDTFSGASETNQRARIQSFNNKSFEIAGWIPAAS